MNARKSVCQRELGVGRLSWPFVQSSTLQCFICNLKKAPIHPYSNFLGVFVWGGEDKWRTTTGEEEGRARFFLPLPAAGPFPPRARVLGLSTELPGLLLVPRDPTHARLVHTHPHHTCSRTCTHMHPYRVGGSVQALVCVPVSLPVFRCPPASVAVTCVWHECKRMCALYGASGSRDQAMRVHVSRGCV